MNRESWIPRLVLVVSLGALCWALGPFHLRGTMSGTVGCAIALLVLLSELHLRKAALNGLLGGALGLILGMFAAALVTVVISRTAEPEPTKSFLEYTALVIFAYTGMTLGATKGSEVHLDAITNRIAGKPTVSDAVKILDTSVLIDGRIADICEAHFLDGTLVVPQFVLHELQSVADSSDGLKRQRGRRGLDVLERMRKMPGVEVRILENGASQTGDVDHKLIELAQRARAKLITNDFNLNKVATVQGLSVLNVNQLANALRPAVLSGEAMRVFILREGKEANQGVAYLDDGTMVVVDGARRFINKNVDAIVTSVHQTAAGKMIFGRLDDRADPRASYAQQAAAAGAGQSDSAVKAQEPSTLERRARSLFPQADAD